MLASQIGLMGSASVDVASMTLNEYLDHLGVVEDWETDETGNTPSFAARSGNTNNDLIRTGSGIQAHSQPFPGYPQVRGVHANGKVNYETGTSFDANLAIDGDLTLGLWVERRHGSASGPLITCGWSGETEPTNYLYSLRLGATNELEAFHEYGAGLDETHHNNLSAPIALYEPFLVFLVRDATANTYTWYTDHSGGTIAQRGSSATYTNDPTGGGSVRIGFLGNLSSTTEITAGINAARPMVFDKKLTTEEMQYIRDKSTAAVDTSTMSLTELLDHAGMIYWDTTELSGNFAASTGHTDHQLVPTAAGSLAYNQSFTNYPNVKGVQFDGTNCFKTSNGSLNGYDEPLIVSSYNETVMVIMDIVNTPPTSSLDSIVDVQGNGETQATNMSTSWWIRDGDNKVIATTWESGNGTNRVTYIGDIPPESELSGENLVFMIRNRIDQEVKLYIDVSGTLTHIATVAYTNDPSNDLSANNKRLTLGGRSFGTTYPFTSGNKLAMLARADRELTTSEMQEILTKARAA